MGNNGSFMEKVYVYLPVLMCHSRMDYSNKSTMWNIRTTYFFEQAVVFSFTAFFIFIIRKRNERRKIFVPDIGQGQAFMNNAPKPEDVMYRQTTYFEHEMTQVFQQLQQAFVAFVMTVVAHFMLGFRPILLLQIFSTPYHFVENRLLRKFVLGLKPGYRVWGERFEEEIDEERIAKENKALGKHADGESEDKNVATGALTGGDSKGVDGVVVGAVAATVEGAGDAAASVPVLQAQVMEVTTVGEDAESELLPMPRALEDALIDAWEAADAADWNAVSEQLGPISVNTKTTVGKWTPLMVACGLKAQVTEDQVKTLVVDLDAEVDLTDEDGWTCLHWAAQSGNAAGARAVLDAVGEVSSEPLAATATKAALVAVLDNDGKSAQDVVRGAALGEGQTEEFIAALSA